MIKLMNINIARKILLDEINDNLDLSNTKEMLLLAQGIDHLTILAKRLRDPEKAKKMDKLYENRSESQK